MTAARNGAPISREIRPSGVLVIDKPSGPTSHDVVARIRKTFRTREVGHAGTLDPMATGVLVLALGEATKLVPWLTAHDKSYRARLSLGVRTDSLDAHGTEDLRIPVTTEVRAALARSSPGAVDPRIETALAVERARTMQIPPAFSALRISGERAFVKARRGEAPTLPPREVRVSRLICTSCSAEPPELELELDVAKGYYVRSLAGDLALSLGTVGHLVSLRRLASGPFVLGEALPWDAPYETLRQALVAVAVAAARALPTRLLSADGAKDARCGRAVRAQDLSFSEFGQGVAAWLDESGALVAVGDVGESGQGRVIRGFSPVASC